jgi:hypothetical protein
VIKEAIEKLKIIEQKPGMVSHASSLTSTMVHFEEATLHLGEWEEFSPYLGFLTPLLQDFVEQEEHSNDPAILHALENDYLLPPGRTTKCIIKHMVSIEEEMHSVQQCQLIDGISNSNTLK